MEKSFFVKEVEGENRRKVANRFTKSNPENSQRLYIKIEERMVKLTSRLNLQSCHVDISEYFGFTIYNILRENFCFFLFCIIEGKK